MSAQASPLSSPRQTPLSPNSNSQDDGQTPHLLSLKVMRLSRPLMATSAPVYYEGSSYPPLVEGLESLNISDLTASHPIELPNDIQIRDFGLSQLLQLPSSFGNIYLGETFSTLVNINNEGQQQHPNGVAAHQVNVKVELQTSSQRFNLSDTNYEQLDTTLAVTVSHEIKELGVHILVCTVQYMTDDGRRRHFRKFYKFQVSNPLAVKTKVNNMIDGRVFLEAQLQNVSAGPMFLERMKFEPSEHFDFQDLNTIVVASSNNDSNIGDSTNAASELVFGTNFIHPQDVRQYLYMLTPKDPQNDRIARTTNALGKLDIVWRSAMGDLGRLQTSQLTRKAPLLDDVEVQPFWLQKGQAADVVLETPFQLGIRVRNHSSQNMKLVLSAVKTKMGSVLLSGLSTRNLGEVSANQSTETQLEFFPLTPGLQRVGGLRVVDLLTGYTKDIDHLCDMYACMNFHNPCNNYLLFPFLFLVNNLYDYGTKMQAKPETIEFFELYEALRQGKMPNNNQLSQVLDRLLDIRAINERQHMMSPDGQKLLADFRALIQTLQTALHVKNRDQLFQSLYYHLHNLNLRPSDAQRERFQTNKTGQQQFSSKEEAKKGGNAFIKIGKLIVTNGHFRDQLTELISIAQEVFGDATNKLSGQLQDTTQKLQEGTQKMNQKAQQLNEKTEDWNAKVQDQSNRDPNEIVDEAGAHINKMRNAQSKQGTSGTNNATDDVYDDAVEQQDSTMTQDDVREKLQSHKQEWKSQMNDQVSQTRNKLQQQQQSAKQYARDKFPPEKVNEIVDRLKTVLAEVQSNPDYQDSIGTIFNLFETWGHRVGGVAQSSAGMMSQTAQEYGADHNLSAAQDEIKAIIEDWAQGRSLDPLIHGVDILIKDVKSDPDLRQCYDQSTQYLRRLLQEPNYVNNDQSTEDGKYLINRMRELTRDRHRDHTDFLINEAKAYMSSLEDDPMARELEMRFKQIHNDLWLDENGNTAFKPQLLTDMRLTLLPVALEFVKFLPIPRIEYSDKQIDLALENIVLPGDTLLPGNVEMNMDNYVRFSPHTNVTNANQQSLYIKMSDIRTTVKDVIWYFKRKVGFPKLSDRGVATVVVGGRKGLSATAKIISDSNDPVHTFRVAQCKCYIDQIKVKINGSRHDILYKTVKPLMVAILRRQIAKAIEAKIIETVEQADGKLTSKMTRQYQESMMKNSSMQTLASNYQPQQQGITKATAPVPGQHTAATTAATGRMPMAQQEMKRPGLFVALLTIMNRSLKSQMVSGVQNQREKHRKKKLEKEKKKQVQQLQQERESSGNDLQQQQGGQQTATSSNNVPTTTGGNVSTVPVIVGSDGQTYMQQEGKMIPVNIVGGATGGAPNAPTTTQGTMNSGSGFFGNKNMQDYVTAGNQDTTTQQYQPGMMASNTTGRA
ncbi:hypothetical protein BDB00DRAFT_784840 [Zychaea mexicana]|uniref:uncharacterized protein n=1 Tax=Zychaea mexicana TaxID=64656 RepID=UPI0022FDC7B2|nr:uncharacterized protein BDB00DRAFT_784840 [Zychaea mexicana]KAI9497518.1 hypothetical protein BDB00DRAFT_784840 [Zychaea mexicana]